MAWRRSRGFTLTELAVVFTVISLLLAAAMYTLSAQTEQRNIDDTRRRLEAARELLLAFAVVNGRLPCPASTTTGATAGFEAPPGGGTCTGPGPYGGWLPARSIGFQVTDAAGNAVDTWGNAIRYAVSGTAPTCVTAPVTPHFTSAANLRTNGISCQPNDLVVCRSATGITATACNTAVPVTNQNTLVAIVFSIGKNGATGAAGIDEAANVNGDRVFVWHTPTPVGAANGAFDDQMTWITAGELYGKLIAAGLLP
ncbi:MAG: prepilin-type N-terminal cleavage/methylation domain-containing protein [Betaproteobacteria bacterium]|nr:prepilin-type N-terminal cleavage/methylation domain-containing protein [Betaproteobacteria bacterium]MDH5578252.1 prepilin-type N-terminal cleavage/methylation domain-containing protein [Betaproteobacteria bacterium]